MIHSNKRKVNLVLFLAACVFVSVAATKPSGTQVKQVSTADTGLFKNLKVLPKDISKEKLDTIMHSFNAALGVRCNFCHSFANGKPDFPNDDKMEKNVARYMLTMTGEINAKYFNFEKSARPDTISVVRCVTCHHGSAHPGEMNEAGEGQNNMQHDSTGKMPPPPPKNQ